MKIIIALLLLISFNSYGFYSDTVVIEDMFGNKLTKCSGLNCKATFQGTLKGFSDSDINWGGSVLPQIDHLDGTQTECLGFSCERKKTGF